MTSIAQVKRLEEALLILLDNNFDADSKETCLTVLKILDNLLQKPQDPKVRKLRCANATFHAKVASRKGAIEFLEACGFQRQTESKLLAAQEEEVLQLVQEDPNHIIAARRLVATRLVHDLGMKEEELPPYRPPPVIQSSTSQEGGFNPYQGHRFDAQAASIGASLGPDANYKSTTEQQLETLQQRQANLEKQLQKKVTDRQWTALLPGESVPSNNSNATFESPSDSALLAARMKKQREEQLKRENGGFTTKAMRDLEKMKNTKVYSHVQLTIQFPDACRLMGRFLPKEKIRDVKQAIQECLDESSRDFDLYMAPPRKLLDEKLSLEKEGLAPAAKIFLSWKVDSAPSKSGKPGSYIRPELFSSSSAPASFFPIAKAIVNNAEKKPKMEDVKKPAAKKSDREEALLKRMLGKR